MILLRGAGLDEQANKQKKAQTAIRYSLFKVQCGTIHPVGSLCGLATGILPEFHQGADFILCRILQKERLFPPYYLDQISS